ncbi:MAG: acetyl-CoA carboxylase biotin carboxyl carrier protein [Candidatus Aerophobetes bacterium]|nr:acetyl-CoA carboxylase biotin carboxyl carrier protein [Candidatus Aerophobetes bacterium]
MDFEELKKLIEIFESSSLSELEVKEGGVCFKLAKRTQTENRKELSFPQIESKEKEKKREGIYVRSPLVGTFYRAPSPGEKPFVEVGDGVSPDQTLCIIEAMKVMNEITSENKGKIKNILVENGEPVEYNQELFLIEEQ